MPNTKYGTFLVFQEGKGEGGRVRQEGKGGERVEHQKRASVGTFVVFDTKGRAGNVSNTKNMPTSRHEGKGRKCTEHYEHAHKGMFIVFGARGTAENVSYTTNTPTRACLWCLRRGEGAEHQNTPFWACFGVQDEGNIEYCKPHLL